MTKFVYLTVDLTKNAELKRGEDLAENERVLDDRGKEGWELVSVVAEHGGKITAYMKKPAGG